MPAGWVVHGIEPGVRLAQASDGARVCDAQRFPSKQAAGNMQTAFVAYVEVA